MPDANQTTIRNLESKGPSAVAWARAGYHRYTGWPHKIGPVLWEFSLGNRWVRIGRLCISGAKR